MQGAGVAPAGPQDPSALFTRLYDEHRRGVHAYLFGRTGDPEVALDLLQETFLRVWRHLPTVQALAPERQRYWIFAVARNLVTDLYRSRAAQRAAHQELSHRAERFAAPADEPAASVEEDERLRMLDAAIQRLPDDWRTILLLHVLGGLTSMQIGEVLDTPAGTVRYKLSLARRQLAQQLRLTNGAGEVDYPRDGTHEMPQGRSA